MNRRQQFGVFFVAVALSGLIFTPAVAQEDDSGGGDESQITVVETPVWSTSTSSTTTTVAVGVGLLSIQLAEAMRRRHVTAYLRHNAVAVQHDLHLGGGELAADLAQVFAVHDGELEEFATLLYERRRDLSPLVVPGAVDEASTRRFIAVVTDAIKTL